MNSVELKIDGTSTDEQFERDLAQVLVRAFELCKRKQASYGPGNIYWLGERGIFVRVWDKIQRLMRLVWKAMANPLHDETISDTWLDILNYSAMAIMVREETFPNPMFRQPMTVKHWANHCPMPPDMRADKQAEVERLLNQVAGILGAEEARCKHVQ